MSETLKKLQMSELFDISAGWNSAVTTQPVFGGGFGGFFASLLRAS